MRTDETIVVGGGIAGLVCAVTLTAAGRPVAVLRTLAGVVMRDADRLAGAERRRMD